MGNDALNAASVLATAEAAGVRFARDAAGAVRLRAASAPPPDVLADLRRYRVDVARVLAERANAALLLRAAGDAANALAGPEIGPVLETGEVDHDEAERAALVALYAEPEAAPQAGPALVDCFPCGRPVLLGDRIWSEAGGWCCVACHAAQAAGNGSLPWLP